jgi:hypothetical protein
VSERWGLPEMGGEFRLRVVKVSDTAEFVTKADTAKAIQA